jgi:8-oxo-dGTP diphosphatase
MDARSPSPTVDVVVLLPDDRVLLVERRHAPVGWALPGGFVDLGETLEAAAVREVKEETGLDARLVEQFHAYSDPRRDPRRHTITTVFIARADGVPVGGDDAARAAAFAWDAHPALGVVHPLPALVFDHAEILADVRRLLLTGARWRL